MVEAGVEEVLSLRRALADDDAEKTPLGSQQRYQVKPTMVEPSAGSLPEICCTLTAKEDVAAVLGRESCFAPS